ncbi:sensor histidine kinase [Dyella humi]|uniref:histidine kinase n=1 Tax=Dyella humi TaxID=1770547 RepID=A0ABW8IHF3_9GAMM
MVMRFAKIIWPRSLSGKLLATSALAIVATSILVACGLVMALSWSRDIWIQGHLAQEIALVENAVLYSDEGIPNAVALSAREHAIYSALPNDVIYRVLDAHGRTLLASDGSTSPLIAIDDSFKSGLRKLQVDHNGVLLDVATAPFNHAGSTYYIQVTKSERMREISNSREALLMMRISLVAALVAMLLFSAVVLLTLRYVLRPLRNVSLAAERIEPRNLTARLNADDLPSDLHALITAFNAALARIEHGYRVQQNFLATVAHELKTPLSLIRSEIELNGTTDRAVLLNDVDYMARQVQQLLHLAEVSEAQNYLLEPTNPANIAQEVADFLGRLAEQCKVSVAIVAPSHPVLVPADPGALYILIKNLLENAIRHSRSGGHIVIGVAANGFSIRDYGTGLAREDLQHLFKRFWRGADNHEGAGLGLSICQEIVRAHGWSITAQNAHPGMVFSVAFEAESVPPTPSPRQDKRQTATPKLLSKRAVSNNGSPITPE